MLSGLASIAGCGFHPLLQPRSADGGPARQLQSVFVGSMPERNGQVFRLALQARLGGGSTGDVKQFELLAPLAVSIDFSAIQRDNSATRFSITASSAWSLVSLAPPRTIVTSGSARVLDGFDQINQQYLSAEFANEDAVRRIADNLADQIVQQLAAYFDGLDQRATALNPH